MKYSQRSPAVLLLEDGTVFYGKSAAKIGTVTGEICFNTGMTGYQEIFTDPSYFGQIMVATHVHIGNYGIKHDESESDSVKISGLVCRSFNVTYSRKMADESILDYFLEQNMVVISDVDTRAIVRHIRDKGAMNAIISSEELDLTKLRLLLDKVPSMSGLELSSKVSTVSPYFFGNPNAPFRVAVMDFGVKKNTLRLLADRNCYVCIYPTTATVEEVHNWNPHGILLSNGPGDPSAMKEVVENVKKILALNIPLFGICLGHQLLALACNIGTYKMHNGHRGINHPVQNFDLKHCEVTSQNHGFAINRTDVDNSSIIESTHVNLNESSVEGIRVIGKKAFSVQYHPESAPGPNDSRYLFDQFLEMISEYATKESESINFLIHNTSDEGKE
jgi:carbamoyl-phosphate synthase small subunit